MDVDSQGVARAMERREIEFCVHGLIHISKVRDAGLRVQMYNMVLRGLVYLEMLTFDFSCFVCLNFSGCTSSKQRKDGWSFSCLTTLIRHIKSFLLVHKRFDDAMEREDSSRTELRGEKRPPTTAER